MTTVGRRIAVSSRARRQCIVASPRGHRTNRPRMKEETPFLPRSPDSRAWNPRCKDQRRVFVSFLLFFFQSSSMLPFISFCPTRIKGKREPAVYSQACFSFRCRAVPSFRGTTPYSNVAETRLLLAVVSTRFHFAVKGSPGKGGRKEDASAEDVTRR